MILKRLISETVIIGFVAFVDLASAFALFLCHRDVTNKEAQAAIEMQVHEAVSAKSVPPSAATIHYSPAVINSMLHPDREAKFSDSSRRILTSWKNQ